MTFTTIDSDGPWKYLDLLNECLKILLTILIGITMGHFKLFDAATFCPQATRFVFNVALPLLVLKGLGVGIDFYNTSLWSYVGAFFIIRLVALLISMALFLRDEDKDKSIGDVAVVWLAQTWISTVILGVPISAAVFGDETKGTTYGIMAAISSFIFQLPFQLFLFECHLIQKNNVEESSTDMEEPGDKKTHNQTEKEPLQENAYVDDPGEGKNEVVATEAIGWSVLLRRSDIWKKIGLQILRNPVLWGIAGGFVLSLSKAGSRFLKPTSDEFIPGLQWFVITCTWFGNCVSPLSLFAMGVWMQSQGRNLFQIPLLSAILYMTSKLIIVPFIMVGLAKALDLDNEAGRAAVLIAALPISLASFSLASRYQIGEAILSANVALGTALVLPTILIWNLILDEVGLFPIASAEPEMLN